MRILLLVLGLLPAAFAGAQVLLVPADAEDPADLVFNPRFIQRNGIASMTGTTHIKRDGEPMYQRPERLHFRFDEQGAPCTATPRTAGREVARTPRTCCSSSAPIGIRHGSSATT